MPVNPIDQNERDVLVQHRRLCRRAWVEGLSDVTSTGAFPTVAQCEQLESLLISLKVSQRRLDDFFRTASAR
jgi:hypothetical protein